MDKKPKYSGEHWNPGVVFGFGLTVLTASLPGVFPGLPTWIWAIGVVAGLALMVSSGVPLYREFRKNPRFTPILIGCVGAVVLICLTQFVLAKSGQSNAQAESAAKTEKIAAAKRWIRLSDEIASEIPSLDASLSSPIIDHDVPREIQERLFRQNFERSSRTLGESMGRMNQKYQGRIGEAVLEMEQFGIKIQPRHGILLLPPGNTIIWNDWAIELGAQGRHMLTTYGVSD